MLLHVKIQSKYKSALQLKLGPCWLPPFQGLLIRSHQASSKICQTKGRSSTLPLPREQPPLTQRSAQTSPETGASHGKACPPQELSHLPLLLPYQVELQFQENNKVPDPGGMIHAHRTCPCVQVRTWRMKNTYENESSRFWTRRRKYSWDVEEQNKRTNKIEMGMDIRKRMAVDRGEGSWGLDERR